MARNATAEEARLWLYATGRWVLANHQRGSNRRTRLAERLRDELRWLLPRAEGLGCALWGIPVLPWKQKHQDEREAGGD